jgi:inosine-uridine nucleoside N-ribohydrolase
MLHLLQSLFLPAVIAATGFARGAQQEAAPVKLIVDTELGSDVSNLISVCSVNAMMDRGEVELKAVLTSTGLPEAIGVISAVNHYYGHDAVELGAYKGVLGTAEVCSNCHGPFVDDIIAGFPAPVKNYSQVLEAHVLYRKVLASQPDGSVVIAAHGFLVNLQHLLNSTADQYSELTGVELVRKKVKKIAIMGGHYPRSYAPGAAHSCECKSELSVGSRCTSSCVAQLSSTVVTT